MDQGGPLQSLWDSIQDVALDKKFFPATVTPVRSEDGLKEMFNDADGMGA